MFESLELFVGQNIDLDHVLNNLTAFRYQKAKKSTQEGEFSQRGGILDVFPLGFDGPVRIDFDNETIRNIASINIKTGKSIWQHAIIIVLPNKAKKKSVFSADIPLNHFVEIKKDDYVVHNQHGIGIRK